MWKHEAKLCAAEAIKQITGCTERTAFTVVGLKSLWHHIQAERKLMTYNIWFRVLTL
jgi:hypothetical protein